MRAFSNPNSLAIASFAMCIAWGTRAEAQPSPFTLGGYVEGYYQWNINNPSNGITNFRGFDNRHNTFSLSNVAFGGQVDDGRVLGRLTLQMGSTPSTYYLAEPSHPGSSGANASGMELWKYLQQAYGGYRFEIGRGLEVSVGIFLSPVGPESMAVHENWNFSRSDLFYGLPYYHTGARATYSLTDHWAITLAVCNGWNSVVDNNVEKSIFTQLTFNRPDLALSLLYFGGVERPKNAPEGKPMRHLLDAHLTWHARPWISLLAHANGGFESTLFGLSYWGAGALYGRLKLSERAFFATRADAFYEHAATNAHGSASPIFWPADWVGSATATFDVRPKEHVSFRFEARHERAASDMFFGGLVVGDGVAAPFVPNRSTQTTLTAGITAWF